jgi:hypothetical protein
MKIERSDHPVGQHGRLKSRAAVGVLVLGLLSVAALPLGAQDKKDSDKSESEMGRNSVGFMASKEVSAKDVGLPLYPGARPHNEKSDESPGVQFGLWGGASGFKLAVLKLESNDAPEKVAVFYRRALAKYGKVLDCGDSSKAASEKPKGISSNELGCDEDRPDKGELVLKAGTKEEQHVVGIKTSGDLTVFQLVYVEARGADTRK